MDPSATESRVRDVIGKTFKLPPGVAAGDLRMGNPPAWDSLGHMTLVVALEKEFGIRFPGYKIPELVSLEAIVRELPA